MNNVWKYSLVLAFSIILDQLIKGSIQSLLEYEGAVKELISSFFYVIRERNYAFFGGITIAPLKTYINSIAILFDSVLMFTNIYRLVWFRNRLPLLGWGHTLILAGLFTSWLDRYSQGFTLNYLMFDLRIIKVTTSLGDFLFLAGLFLTIPLEVKWRKCETNPS